MVIVYNMFTNYLYFIGLGAKTFQNTLNNYTKNVNKKHSTNVIP